MSEDAVVRYITDTFAGVEALAASGDYYFFYQPGGNVPPDHRFPFATLVTADRHDRFSNLDRPGVFRLNVGVAKETFRSLFGPQPPEDGYDFTVLDRIMPHPVYGKMYWVCVLSPGGETFEAVKPLLAEAYDAAVKRHTKAHPTEET
ncbi:MAG: hypothetical protein J0I06_24130 [Planctomycetes bacterium]|nr:hypothetical protein [Planctomycetota bacterium]